jgi:hypothetical protein
MENEQDSRVNPREITQDQILTRIKDAEDLLLQVRSRLDPLPQSSIVNEYITSNLTTIYGYYDLMKLHLKEIKNEVERLYKS